MSLFFDEASYLRSKLSLMSAEEKAEKHISTTAELKAYMSNVGMTPEEHYNLYGRDEGLNPNPYFNEDEYLLAKLDQLHSIDERDANGQPYTLETLKKAIADNGMTPIEHYERYGAHETKADGTLINPSNAFDANAYAAAKLYQLQHSTDKAEAAAWADKTPADVMQAIKDAGMSPVSHYLAYGADEANADKVPMVQTVPSEQRVANDPLRDQLGENVPSNYNPPSEGPAKAKPAPVDKPADVGDLANHAISPEAASPDEPVKVPGDKGYVAPPDNITDTNANPVIPPTTSGTGKVSDNWLVVNSTTSAIVVDKDGTILGEVHVSTTDDGTVTVPPSESTKPVDKLPAVDPDDLPPNVEPGHEGDNIKPDTPDVPDTPDTPDVPTPTPDTTPPSVPTIAKVTGDDVIDRSEMLAGVKITGRAEAGSTVKIIISDTDNKTADVTLTSKADNSGNYSVDLTNVQLSALKDGKLTVTATATDAAGNTSKAETSTVTLDAGLDATFSATTGESVTVLGHTHTEGQVLTDAKLGTLDATKTGGLLNELQKVFDNVTGTGTVKAENDYNTVEDLAKDAPSFSKVVRFYSTNNENNKPNQSVFASDEDGRLNIAAHDLYGGGLSLSLQELNAIDGKAGRVAALEAVLSKAKFDLPEIDATATNGTVFLEVDKVGSSIKSTEAFPLNSGLLDTDLTFAKAVEFASRVKPVAVDAHAQTLDIRLADKGDADIVNLMEVRGDASTIHFSGTQGHFGINVDTSSVSTIDASALGTSSGVYVNTAPVEVHLPIGSGDPSLGFHADVADKLTFTGGKGNDLLVMTAEKYAAATKIDGGAGNDDTLVIVNDTDNNDNINEIDGQMEYTVSFEKSTTNFENVGLTSFEHLPDARFIIKDASTFTGVKQFITTNDLTIAKMASGTEISVVSLMDAKVKLDLVAANANSSATINLTMTDNFLLHLDALLDENGTTPAGRAVLTNADNINNLILKGADANADILLTNDALTGLGNNGTIDVSGYKGDIQLTNEWTYKDGAITNSTITITVTGVQDGTDITVDAAGA